MQPDLHNDSEHASASGVAPDSARDMSHAIDGRRNREARRRAARRRSRIVGATVVIVALGALAVGWQFTSGQRASGSTVAEAVSAEDRPGAPGGAVVRAANPAPAPTPYFASYKKLKLRLPVAVADLTEVGFHQASYAYARHLDTHLSEADNGDAKKARSTKRDLTAQSSAADAELVGEALVMWRSRPGKPDSAADVGADPGSDVFSPVDGTVVKVKEFDLYGKYPDYEIHIQPAGYPGLDLVLIHVDDLSCAPGDRVAAGVTRIAAVRKLDKRVRPQLRSYTDNGGHHTHLQINDATHPEYKGLKGAITVPATPVAPQRSAQ